MTTFEQTWQQANNVVPSDQTTVALQAKSMLWWIKAFLKGETGGATTGLWTCAGSSDSSTAGMDASDRWTSSFDATKIVRASGAVAHSWIVLYSADLAGYLLIDWNASSDQTCVFTFSKTAFAGGTITAAPTSAVSWTYAAQQFTNSSITAAHMFGLLAEDGDFHIKFGQDASAQFTFSLSAFALADTRTGDAHNLWSYCDYAVAGVWVRTTLNVSSSSKIKGRNKDNTAAVEASFPTPMIGGSTYVMSDVSASDATDSKSGDFWITLYVYTVAHKSQRGRLRDIAWCPEASPVATVEPIAGPPYETTVVGDTWHPYSASVAASL
jgi:hypothetical protein